MILTEIYVRCDDVACGQTLHFKKVNDGGLTVNEAVIVSTRRYGWQASSARSKVFCPKHRGRHPRAHEFEPGGSGGLSCDATPKGRGCWLPAEHYIHAEGPVAD